MTVCCEQDDRRDAVRERTGWNGLDYVELGADDHSLRAVFLGKLPPELAQPAPNLARFLALDGGVRITGITILSVQPVPSPDPELDDALLIVLDRTGDFSTYTLRLVGVANTDPRYASADFSFKIDCPTDLDCKPVIACPPDVPEAPDINYLAKDYTSFRQLLFDRLALLMPNWTERHVPDIGVTLLELLAWQGDMLSYYQDSVATEATLDAARLRISVRRHARLVDYFLHEGCNARTWLCFDVGNDLTLDPAHLSFLAGLAGQPGPTILTWDDVARLTGVSLTVFEPLVPPGTATLQLRAAHNEITFYDFGQRLCCLEKGATQASLRDTGLDLAPGDVLIFEENRDPRTGLPADANPARRWAVRLVSVTNGQDLVLRGPDGAPTPYVDITWGQADALPFPLCLSAISDGPDCRYYTDITVARGNVLLVDHGQTMPPVDLGTVPALLTTAPCDCADVPGSVVTIAGPFNPALPRAGLTWRVPADSSLPASAALRRDPRAAEPGVSLTSLPARTWRARPDLVESQPTDADFVVETDDQNVAHLRFGDGSLGLLPPAGMSVLAQARYGNGPAGNVGAETITRMVLTGATLDGVAITLRNPLPASGGLPAETIAQAKMLAPGAFRQTILRAITADDYATIAERDPRLQRASARLIWTGSWYEADVAADPLGSETAGHDLLESVDDEIQPFRRIGHDLRVQRAAYVPLDVAIEACALPAYRRSDVLAALTASFGTGVLTDGSLGYFNPDALSFGDDIYISRIVARAQAIPGVASVTVTRLQRLFIGPNDEIEAGLLSLAPWEIAQADSDPNRPENGRVKIKVRGGH